jgi:hypothetical protein
LARKVRTAKTLARRIDLGYFKRSHPFRRWRALLSVAAPLAGLAWLGVSAAGGTPQSAFSAGQVSPAHAMFGPRCETCHLPPSSGGFRHRVTGQACLACHSAPAHSPRETVAPDCSSCHVEHRGTALAAVPDLACAACHADLTTTGGPIEVDASIRAFPHAHPEFALLRDERPDPGALRFNHAAHMRDDLPGPDGPVRLDCQTCHAPAVQPSAWAGGASRRVRGEGVMARIEFKAQCASCHPLFFDPRLAEQAPHDRPEIVRAFVEARLREYVARHPDTVALDAEAMRRRLPGFPPGPPPRTADGWVQVRLEEAERLLWQKTCRQCHVLTGQAEAAVPAVAPPAVPERWFTRARFDHAAHAGLTCTSCHAQALESVQAADVLLPGLATCQQCHQPQRAAASSDCSTCHAYHDWSQQEPVRGRYTIDELGRTR